MINAPICTTETSYRFFVNGKISDSASELKIALEIYDKLLRRHGFDAIEIHESVKKEATIPGRAFVGFIASQSAGLPDALSVSYRIISPEELRQKAYSQSSMSKRRLFDFNR